MLVSVKVLKLVTLGIPRQILEERINIFLDSLEDSLISSNVKDHTIAALGLVKNGIPHALETSK